MIELLLTVCLINEPAKCKDVSLVYADISSMQCVMGAQPEIAKWSNGHPLWSVSRWKCRQAGRFARI